jgi:hypothetical protein
MRGASLERLGEEGGSAGRPTRLIAAEPRITLARAAIIMAAVRPTARRNWLHSSNDRLMSRRDWERANANENA